MRELLILALILSSGAIAEEDQIRFKEGPGRDLVMSNCVMCHSLDYIPMNSPILDRQGWEALVNKMVNVMGAPLKPEDAYQIVEYLAKYYGK